MARIADIRAREVLDSRARPTVEVDVLLDNGMKGTAMVPSGASTGRHEAWELRDGDPHRHRGYGTQKAVAHVRDIIAPALRRMPVFDQKAVDARLLELDGTPNKGRLGANALLGVSLANAQAAAAATGLPLYRYLGQELGAGTADELPLPMVNMISGGLHAGGNLDMQDFLIIPVGASTYRQALDWICAVYWSLRDRLIAAGHPPLVGDEGGYGPALASHQEALDFLMQAIEGAGLRPGDDVVLAVDVAATHFFRDGRYRLRSEGRELSAGQLVDWLTEWTRRYPILSIEDGLAEDDWDGWQQLTRQLSGIQVLGDDLFTTNPRRLARGIAEGVANAVLIKPNQIGTLSETLAVIAQARRAGYLTVVSARSGETEDSFIADLSVATNSGQIKIGSVARSERLAKYNRLLRIEEELGSRAVFRGRQVFQGLRR